jgi:hypothetical protein
MKSFGQVSHTLPSPDRRLSVAIQSFSERPAFRSKRTDGHIRLRVLLEVWVAIGPRAGGVVAPPRLSTGRAGQVFTACAQVILLVKDRVLTGRIAHFGPFLTKSVALLGLHFLSLARVMLAPASLTRESKVASSLLNRFPAEPRSSTRRNLLSWPRKRPNRLDSAGPLRSSPQRLCDCV